jgi:integrase
MGSRRTVKVDVRAKSIRLIFTWEGVQRFESLPGGITPPEQRAARRVAAQLLRALESGTFSYHEFFPDSPNAGASGERTVRHYGELWHASKGALAEATRYQYQGALDFWYAQPLDPGRTRFLLGDAEVTRVRHSQLAALVGRHPWPSNRMMNNRLIPLRGLFEMASKDCGVSDPSDGIKAGRVQKAPPDPLDGEEREIILADLAEHYQPNIVNYFEFAFLTGLRPEEEVALLWRDYEARRGSVRVERARSFRGRVKPTKTYEVRDLELTTRARAVLERQRVLTGKSAHGHIFENPQTGNPWYDGRSQREEYWDRVFERVGIRARVPYQTRHTYATLALMGGVNPAYIARQLGHKNTKMLYETYAKWIDGADRGRELAKLEDVHGAVPVREYVPVPAGRPAKPGAKRSDAKLKLVRGALKGPKD